MVYREHSPAPGLARFVECYWTIRAGEPAADSPARPVLPDGCMDILFDLSTTGDGLAFPDGQVVGTMRTALHVIRSGRVRLLGIRFRPGASRPWLSVEAHTLTDGRAGLGDVWGAAAGETQDRLMSASADQDRIALLDEILLARLGRTRTEPDEAVLRASEVAASAPHSRVDALARASGLGRRQLERRFLAEVGISPKMACRVARLRKAVAALHAHPRASLAGIALGAGYSDQPHFNREFRTLSGLTPGRYRALYAGAPRLEDAFVQDAAATIG